MLASTLKNLRLPGDLVPRTIGILGFDGVAALDLLGPLEAFKAARAYDHYHHTHSCYDVLVLGLAGGQFVSRSGIDFKADEILRTVSSLDTLIIPGNGGEQHPEMSRTISLWLRGNANRVRRIVSVSTGIYALAEGGFLDGRQVTTHWRFCRDLSKRFPKLHVSDTASFVKDGPFYTSGGGSAGMEMTLALIAEDHGESVALEVAREFVIRLRPAGAERAVIHPPRAERESSERLTELPAWILSHLHEKLSVEALAQRACVCPRHFSRLFKEVFRTTPAEFVEQLRLGEARRRLAMPRAKIETVAASVGFKSADAFRRAFERQIGMSPSKFRMRSQMRNQSALDDRGRAPAAGTGQWHGIAERQLANALN
jgi:transcriptional regulator GlxA family with amidase domain